MTGGCGNATGTELDVTTASSCTSAQTGRNQWLGGGITNVVAPSSTGGSAIGGELNQVNGEFAAGTGGFRNRLTGSFAAATGGNSSQSLGEFTSILGGQFNLATGEKNTAVGGCANVAGRATR